MFTGDNAVLHRRFHYITPVVRCSGHRFCGRRLGPLHLPVLARHLSPPLISLLIVSKRGGNGFGLNRTRIVIRRVHHLVTLPRVTKHDVNIISLLNTRRTRGVVRVLAGRLKRRVVARFRVDYKSTHAFRNGRHSVVFLDVITSPNSYFTGDHSSVTRHFGITTSQTQSHVCLIHDIRLASLDPISDLHHNLVRRFRAPFARSTTRIDSLHRLYRSNFRRRVCSRLARHNCQIVPRINIKTCHVSVIIRNSGSDHLTVRYSNSHFRNPSH